MKTDAMKISLRQVLQFIWKHLIQRPVLLVVLLMLRLFLALADITVPYLMGLFTDYLVKHVSMINIDAFYGALPIIGFITLAEVILGVGKPASYYLYDKYFILPMMEKVNRDVFMKVQYFSTEWHINSFSGAITRKITRGVYAIDTVISSIHGRFIPLALIVLGTIIWMFVRWPQLGLIFLIGTIIYGFVSFFLAISYISPTADAATEADSKASAVLSDSITANSTVKAFAGEDQEKTRYFDAIQTSLTAMFRNWTRQNTAGMLQAMISKIIQFCLFIFIAWLWSKEKASIGDIIFVLGIYAVFSSQLSNLGESLRQIRQSISDMKDIVYFSLEPIQVVDCDNKALKVQDANIVFNKVSFQYPNQAQKTYENISLSIPAKQKIALVGTSGGGKSTLVKLIQRLYDIQQGEILIDGQNIAKVTQESLRKNIALVPQDPILFHRTLAENIAYGKPNATQEEVATAAKLAHAHEFIEQFPHKYQTLVGERGVKLSGGERQRVAIARAILANTPIIILDEATSSLDSESEKYIQDSLHHLLQGKTAIIVAHRLSTIKEVDRILVFDKGKIIEDGSFEELLAKNGKFAKLWKLQKLD